MLDFSQPVSCLDTDREKNKMSMSNGQLLVHVILSYELIIECIQYLNDHGGSGHGERRVSSVLTITVKVS